MKIYNNITDFANHIGVEVKHLERAIYKGTECGAWINWDDEKLTIGSIVEGSDAEFSKTFKFPVSSDEIDNWINELEDLCEEAWCEANENHAYLQQNGDDVVCSNCRYPIGYNEERELEFCPNCKAEFVRFYGEDEEC